MADKMIEVSPQEFFEALSRSQQSQGFIPNLTQELKARGSDIIHQGQGKIPHPESGDTWGGTLGQLLARTIVDAPATIGALSIGGPVGLGVLGAYHYLTSPGTTSADKLQEAIISTLPMATPQIARAIPKGRPSFKPYESVKDFWEDIKKPGKIQEDIDALKTKQQETKVKGKEAEEAFRENIDKHIFDKEQQLTKVENNLEKQLTLGEQGATRGQLNELLGDLAENLKNQSKANYEAFVDKYGNMPIKNPVNMDLSRKTLSLIPETSPLIKELQPYIQKSLLVDKYGKPLETYNIAPPANVNDYVNLYRAVRDSIEDLRDQSYKAIGKQKNDIVAAIKELTPLRNALEKEKLASLPKEGKEAFIGAQKFYKDYIVPQHEHTQTKSILQKGKVPDNYFESLNQPGYKPFMDKILENEQLRNALSQHMLSKKDLLNMTPTKIFNFIDSDAGKLLPDNLRHQLAQYAGHKHDLSYLNKMKSQAKTASSPNAIMREVLQKHPELQKPFKDLKDVQKRMKELDKLLLEKGIEKAEAEKIKAKYFKAVAALKTIKKVKDKLFSIF